MNPDGVIVLEMSRLEAAHLTDLLTQFTELLADSTHDGGQAPADPAIARLVPDAYADDAKASQEFRDVTERDLLSRRAADAATVLSTLAVRGQRLDPTTLPGDATAAMAVTLDGEALRAWLRTLTALRLVLASRLGIQTENDHDDEDPRFGIYDWLGYRLDGLVRAAESA